MIGDSLPQDRLVEWFMQWRQPICRFLGAYRSIHRADIEDVAQEVFLRMVRYERSAVVANPQSYLFKTAANVAAEWSMRPQQRRPHASEWLTELTVEASSESDLIDQTEGQALLNAVEALPARAREMLRLHFAESLTREQIAARMGVSSRVVKRELIRSYAALRLSLGEPEATAGPEGSKRTRAKKLSVAAALVAIGTLAVSLYILLEAPSSISTRAAERRQITLDDGSDVTLAPNSRARIQFTSSRRVVLLDRGEAFFHVRSDPRRPFLVESGNASTRVIGTSFSVERRPDKVVVTVVEGRVSVNPTRGADVSVGANEQVALTDNGTVAPVHKVNGKVETAWLQGELIFDNDSVAAVVERFNTYNRIQIRVADSQLANQPVTAVFQATDPESFVAFLQSVAGIKVQRISATEISIASPATRPEH